MSLEILNMSSPLAMPSPRKKVVAATIVVATASFIIGLIYLLQPVAPEPTIEDKPTLVNTELLTHTKLKPSFRSIGKIKASAPTELRSQVVGEVETVLVEPGQQVQQGDVLIEINDTEQLRQYSQSQAQYASAKAALAQATAQHEADLELLEKDNQLLILANRSLKRYKDLQKRNLATEAQVDQANELEQRQASSKIQRQTTVDTWPDREAQLLAQLKAAQDHLAQAEADLASTQLKAPFNGSVQHLAVAPQSRITPNMPLINLIKQEQLVLEVSIPPRMMDRPNDQLDFSAQATLFGETIHFRLKTIGQKASGNGNSVALFTPVNPSQFLPVNRNLLTTVTKLYQQSGYQIPVQALHDQEYIYLLDEENRLARTKVTLLGEAWDQEKRFYIIDTSSIPVNTKFVTNQLVRDFNGKKVQPFSEKGGV